MQGHSGSTKATNQRCMLSATKQAVSITLATAVVHCLCEPWPWCCKRSYGLTNLFICSFAGGILAGESGEYSFFTNKHYWSCFRRTGLCLIQGHADLNHDNNKCFIISETIQAMPITFAVKIARVKVHMTIAVRLQLSLCLKLDNFLTCNISDNIEYVTVNKWNQSLHVITDNFSHYV